MRSSKISLRSSEFNPSNPFPSSRAHSATFLATAQGTVGRDVAALIGASLLNLVDAVIREQGGPPSERRRGALVVVVEMQSMLSELGKFGASFVLATQSLAKLEDLSRTMQDAILATSVASPSSRSRARTRAGWSGSWDATESSRATSPPCRGTSKPPLYS